MRTLIRTYRSSQILLACIFMIFTFYITGHFIEMMATACAKCDPKLKHMTEEFLLNVMVKYPNESALLNAKYDPDHKLANLVMEVSKY